MDNGQINISLEDIVNQSDAELNVKIEQYKMLLQAQGIDKKEYEVIVKDRRIKGFKPHAPLERIIYETTIDINKLNF